MASEIGKAFVGHLLQLKLSFALKTKYKRVSLLASIIGLKSNAIPLFPRKEAGGYAFLQSYMHSSMAKPRYVTRLFWAYRWLARRISEAINFS